MNEFGKHLDEPREIGKKKVRLSRKELMMVKQDLTERIVKKKLREYIKKQMEK